MSALSTSTPVSGTPNAAGLEPVSVGVDATPALKLCYGAKSKIKPWAPHALCRGCLRYTWLGPAEVKPAIQGGDCAMRVEA